ncbi:MAG: 2-dehydropantoate 2-reductase [Bradyrhizobiaceae bacterium]|nr:2-dehydropantoate 2-reductase [Bradyrhizobiaceae bacterium]
MRIGVMAAGAVGGYFGARLAAAGHDVIFFARGANLEAIRRNGLIIESPLGNLHLTSVNVTDDPGSVAPVDVVLFAVKLWDLESAAQSIGPLIGLRTQVITLQNGIDAVERVAPILGVDHVAGGTAQIVSVIAAPGVIKHSSKVAIIRCGHIDRHSDPTLVAFADAGKKAGFDISLSDDIERDLWDKFVMLAGTSGITAATREPVGRVLADPDTRALFLSLMQETVAVARAKSVRLPEDFAQERLHFVEANFPFDMRASMANDIERGNRLELDWLAGRVVELGRALGVPTPANAAVYAVLKLHRMGKPGKGIGERNADPR